MLYFVYVPDIPSRATCTAFWHPAEIQVLCIFSGGGPEMCDVKQIMTSSVLTGANVA